MRRCAIIMVSRPGGILVDSVIAGQAADKAGMKDEDIIIEYNGTKVTDRDQFVQLVERTEPGTKASTGHYP